ncbi:MAG: hypothetical protein V4712_15115 [Pseudomonadota bacterium]
MIANTKRPANLDAACAFIPALRAELATMPRGQSSAGDVAAIHRRLMDVILSAGGHARNDWNGAAIRLHGFRATSTAGVAAACQNWIAQVTLKAAAAAMEGQSQ